MKKKIQTATLLFGLVLALVIGCAHIFNFQPTINNKQVKTEQKKSEQSESISVSSISLPTSNTVSLHFDLYYIFEIVSEIEIPDFEFDKLSIQPQKLFRTLFSVIISPNAP
ncbi:hypothetical protein [Chryseosolibacter indicus]|uniref:Lipoprotein n=1 Tax=Chryseosolibacter indicus TaxID=2782351 RepID=A0ABS5VTT9_9BACT|nr:hypothetical protein [Chryseosolibacter indicus]MBT1704242.1 hypothetical protein [Chryseosolibacter indicus]